MEPSGLTRQSAANCQCRQFIDTSKNAVGSAEKLPLPVVGALKFIDDAQETGEPCGDLRGDACVSKQLGPQSDSKDTDRVRTEWHWISVNKRLAP